MTSAKGGLTSSWLDSYIWLLNLSCRPFGACSVSRSRCKDWSSFRCLLNWLRGLTPAEHSGPPSNDMTDVGGLILRG